MDREEVKEFFYQLLEEYTTSELKDIMYEVFKEKVKDIIYERGEDDEIV